MTVSIYGEASFATVAKAESRFHVLLPPRVTTRYSKHSARQGRGLRNYNRGSPACVI